MTWVFAKHGRVEHFIQLVVREGLQPGVSESKFQHFSHQALSSVPVFLLFYLKSCILCTVFSGSDEEFIVKDLVPGGQYCFR